MSYLPIPPRVWSRVQNPCSALLTNDQYIYGTSIFNGKIIPYAQANYELQLYNKGNILQYKANSSQLTKKQKYTQLAKGLGPNRTKVYATQSTTYSNPNTKGLLRVGSTIVPYPNFLVGQPNNPSGPFQTDVPNPNNCANTNGSLEEGGTLVCGSYQNPCTKQILKQGKQSAVICNSSSASDVPGRPVALCWNSSIQTWYPKPRYLDNNSGDKWPTNYKGFVSAERPDPPTITSLTGLTLSWVDVNSCVIPTTNFRIYVNGRFFIQVGYSTTSYTFSSLQANSSIYMTSVSRNIESVQSNSVVYL